MEIAIIGTLGFLCGALAIALVATCQKLRKANYELWLAKGKLKFEIESVESWHKQYCDMYDKYEKLYNKTPEGLAKIARQKMQDRARELMKGKGR